MWRDMSSKKKYLFLANVLDDVGLSKCNNCYRDVQFIVALLAGIPVVWLVHDWLPVFSSSFSFQWWMLLSIVIWQPLIEELLFRGIIQGQLYKYKWAQQSIFNITNANIVTSILFVAIHFVKNPSAWPLLIFVPSLVFGYFRDAFNSVYPSMILHMAYNLFVLIGLLIYAN